MGSFFEFFTGVNGRDDYGDVFRGNVGGVFGKRDRTVCEGSNDTEHVPEVAVEARKAPRSDEFENGKKRTYPMTPNGTTVREHYHEEASRGT